MVKGLDRLLPEWNCGVGDRLSRPATGVVAHLFLGSHDRSSDCHDGRGAPHRAGFTCLSVVSGEFRKDETADHPSISTKSNGRRSNQPDGHVVFVCRSPAFHSLHPVL